MKILFLFIIFTFLSQLFSQDLKIMYGDRIYYNYKGHLIEVKSVEHCKDICGYDLIDSTNIFIAYNMDDPGEPNINVSIYDVINRKEIHNGELPGSSDTNFNYNRDNDYLVFNLFDGIYILKIHRKDGTIIKDVYGKSEKILSCNNCYNVFWIDKKTVGYYSRLNDEDVLKMTKFKNN